MEIRTEQHHEHLTKEKKRITAQIRSVAVTLYERVYLDKSTVEFLREHFYKDPTLALAYFYCCSTDPHVAIFNDKLQPKVDGSVIWNRLSNLIGSPIGQEEVMLVKRHSTTLTNHMQELLPVHLVVNQQGIVEMKIDDLSSEFFLTESQIECLTTLSPYIVQNHIQVVDHNGSFYHLNPDLVFDVNQIVLCHVCEKNPMIKDQ
jgi:hypothetical protein